MSVASTSESRSRDPRTCLIVSSGQADYAFVEVALSRLGWLCERANSQEQARALLSKSAVAVVIVEESLAKGGWIWAFGGSSSRFHPPKVVVICQFGCESTKTGAASVRPDYVIQRPFSREHLIHVAGMAWLDWLEEHASEAPPATFDPPPASPPLFQAP